MLPSAVSYTFLPKVLDILIQFEPDCCWLRGQRLYGKPCTFKLFSIFSSSLNRIPAGWEARGCMESHVPSSCSRYSHPVWTGLPLTERPEAVWKAMYLQAVFDILIQFETDSRWLGGQGLDMTAAASHQAVQQLTCTQLTVYHIFMSFFLNIVIQYNFYCIQRAVFCGQLLLLSLNAQN